MRSWIPLIILALGPAVGNGFARFGYALILPSMKTELGWTYALAGWINTTNALGYLIGAVLALLFSYHVQPVKLFLAGMLLTSLSLLGSGLTNDFYLLNLTRILSGIGGAAVFISGAVIAAAFWSEHALKNALAIAIYFGGVGAGMLATALILPPMFAIIGDAAWGTAWIILGSISLGLTLLCLFFYNYFAAKQTQSTQFGLPIRRLFPSLVGYFIFAIGYIIYMTFVIAWLQQNGAPVAMVVLCWGLIGGAVMIAPFLWRHVLQRYNNGFPLAASSLATAVGTLFPIFFYGWIGVMVSAILFGLSFLIAPTAVTAFSKKNLPKAQWGGAIALYTTAFSIGQTIGPIGAGYLSDYSADLSTGLIAGGIILLIAAIFALFQKTLTVQD